ncbi:MAG: PilZ domain-containing protein [Pseudomonadota bacterium]|nr:PilZ domain-containing protein [Pseudomonadota bacterium]
MKNKVLSLSIKDKSSLYASYMPFLENGGIFIPSEQTFELGEEVFMLVNLVDDNEKIPLSGKIVWITPKGAQNNKTAGVGVQFNSLDKGATRDKIEKLLAGALSSDRKNHTM